MRYSREVWKIGGSVLRCDAAFQQAAARIEEHLSSHPWLERLYVVVSAAHGVTNNLVKTTAARQGFLDSDLNGLLKGKAEPKGKLAVLDSPRTAIELLQGELDSVHRLRMELVLKGISAKACTQCDFFPITAEGSYLRARYDHDESLRRFRLFDHICRGIRVVLLSGFGGINGSYEPVILGRNASDYVAALMSRLDGRVGLVTFIKESGAIYQDFNSSRPTALREINSSRLHQSQFAQVLDQRILSAITSDFRVCGLSMAGGTWVNHLTASRQPELTEASG